MSNPIPLSKLQNVRELDGDWSYDPGEALDAILKGRPTQWCPVHKAAIYADAGCQWRSIVLLSGGVDTNESCVTTTIIPVEVIDDLD